MLHLLIALHLKWYMTSDMPTTVGIGVSFGLKCLKIVWNCLQSPGTVVSGSTGVPWAVLDLSRAARVSLKAWRKSGTIIGFSLCFELYRWYHIYCLWPFFNSKKPEDHNHMWSYDSQAITSKKPGGWYILDPHHNQNNGDLPWLRPGARHVKWPWLSEAWGNGCLVGAVAVSAAHIQHKYIICFCWDFGWCYPFRSLHISSNGSLW